MEPLEVDVVVEIPRGKRNKYEFDEEAGVVRLSRRVYAPVAFPADYGFVAHTVGKDGDALDALVLLEEPSYPGVWVRSRVIGSLRLNIGGNEEDKVLAVAVSDPMYEDMTDLDDLSASSLEEIHAFFEMYRSLEKGSTPEVVARLGAADAREVVEEAQERAGRQ